MTEWKGLLWVLSQGHLEGKGRKEIGGRGHGSRYESETGNDHQPGIFPTKTDSSSLTARAIPPAGVYLGRESEATWGKQQGGGGHRHAPY